MSPGNYLRSAFSCYAIAVLGGIVALTIALVAFLALASGHIAIGLILMLSVPIVGLAAEEMARCPGCGKPPTRFYLTAWGERRGSEPVARRLWPERTCSSCGSPLDIL